MVLVNNILAECTLHPFIQMLNCIQYFIVKPQINIFLYFIVMLYN